MSATDDSLPFGGGIHLGEARQGKARQGRGDGPVASTEAGKHLEGAAAGNSPGAQRLGGGHCWGDIFKRQLCSSGRAACCPGRQQQGAQQQASVAPPHRPCRHRRRCRLCRAACWLGCCCYHDVPALRSPTGPGAGVQGAARGCLQSRHVSPDVRSRAGWPELLPVAQIQDGEGEANGYVGRGTSGEEEAWLLSTRSTRSWLGTWGLPSSPAAYRKHWRS